MGHGVKNNFQTPCILGRPCSAYKYVNKISSVDQCIFCTKFCSRTTSTVRMASRWVRVWKHEWSAKVSMVGDPVLFTQNKANSSCSRLACISITYSAINKTDYSLPVFVSYTLVIILTKIVCQCFGNHPVTIIRANDTKTELNTYHVHKILSKRLQ